MLADTFDGPVLRDRFSSPAFRDDCHSFAVTGIPPNMRFDAARGGRRFSIDQSEINLLDAPQPELVLEPAMGALVLGEQDQTRCLFVQAMDHTGPLLTTDPFDI